MAAAENQKFGTDEGVPIVIVDLASPGGDLIEAMKIGRQLRARFAYTRVSAGNVCASACVMVLAAGVQRIVAPRGRVIIHRPMFDPAYFAGLSAQESIDRYDAMLADLRKYLADMGMTPDLYEAIREVPSSGAVSLSRDQMYAFDLIGEDPAWSEKERADNIARYGPARWGRIEKCLARADTVAATAACYQMQ